MRIIFMGTPEPAAQILRELVSAQHEIVCVVTQPDRPKGRGQKMSFPPAKEVALKHALPVEQPEKIKGNTAFISLLKSLKPAIVVVAAYGKILPKEILDIPKHGCINIHASLLPKYRGAAPIQWALLNGEKETGITVMKIKEQLDAGDIILQGKVKIREEDDAVSLSKKLFEQGGKLLLEAIEELSKETAKYRAQNEAEATYAPSLTRESGEIDWRKSALEIHNRIRALVLWPVAQTIYKGKLLKIWKSQIHIADLGAKFKEPGAIVGIAKNLGFIVATGKGHLLILNVQPEGKKRMKAFDFVIGHDVKIGETLPN